MRDVIIRLFAGLALAAVLVGGGGESASAQGAHAHDNLILAQNRDPIGSFFRQLFGGFQRPPQRAAPPPAQRRYAPRQNRQQPQSRRSGSRSGSSGGGQQRAPEPKVVSKDADARQVVVFGDFFAEGLEQGLEEAFVDTSNVVVAGKTDSSSGLVRRDHLDWPAEIRSYLEDPEKKVDIAVVMIGGNDRQPLSDSTGEHEPRSEGWRELYVTRIDEVMDVFHQAGVPVYWVGLPPVQSDRLSQHYAFFNDLYRERAYRAGADFIDVWNSFVDENGDYAATGPDVNGESRQLRAENGLHLTEAGNRKLAHFVSREIRRDVGRDGDMTVSLPRGPIGPQPFIGSEEARDTGVGEVVTLTGGQTSVGGLAGGIGGSPEPPRDSVYYQTILLGESGEPKPGRSDDFSWPPGTEERRSRAGESGPARPPRRSDG